MDAWILVRYMGLQRWQPTAAATPRQYRTQDPSKYLMTPNRSTSHTVETRSWWTRKWNFNMPNKKTFSSIDLTVSRFSPQILTTATSNNRFFLQTWDRTGKSRAIYLHKHHKTNFIIRWIVQMIVHWWTKFHLVRRWFREQLDIIRFINHRFPMNLLRYPVIRAI